MPVDQSGPLRPSGPPLGGDREITFRRRSWWRKHRVGILAVVIVVLLVGGITGAVLATRNIGDVTAADPSSAAASSSAAPKPSPSPTAHPTASSTPKPTPTTTATGTVVAVITTGQWTVSFEKGLNLTVVANGSTKFPKGKKASDIKRNTSITVVGTLVNGVITAKSLTIGKKRQ